MVVCVCFLGVIIEDLIEWAWLGYNHGFNVYHMVSWILQYDLVGVKKSQHGGDKKRRAPTKGKIEKCRGIFYRSFFSRIIQQVVTPPSTLITI